MKNKLLRCFCRCGSVFLLALLSSQLAIETFGAAGDLDQSFGIQGRRIKTVPNSQPQNGHDFFSADIVIQPDGKILIAGYAFDSLLGDSMVIARYNANGTLDSGFANGGIFRYEHGNVYSTDKLSGIALQADGKIVGAGRVTVGNGDPAFAVIRLNPNGSFDASFGTNGIVVKNFFSSIDEATEAAVQTDGKILVSGWVTQGGVNDGTTYDFAVVRYNPDGTEDTSYGNGGVVFTDFGGRGDIAQAAVLQPDGKYVVAGWVSVPGSQYDFGLARYNTDGSLDTTFDGDGKVVTPIGNNVQELLRGIALAPGGKIVATGELYNPSIPGGGSGHSDVVVVRYNPNGSLDQSFDADGKFVYDSNLGDRNESGEDTVVQPDGKILVAGRSHLRQVQQGTSDVDMLLMRVNASGGLDGDFGSGGITYTDFGIFAGPFTTPRSGDKGSAIALQSDGKIVVAGDSYFAGDTTELLGSFNNRLAVARFQNDIGAIAVRRTGFDFDGDGRADVSVFRPSNSVWYLQQSNAGFAAFQFGISTDRITPADFDGDGKTDASVYRDGVWYTLRSSDSRVSIVQWGLAGDIPQPVDFDGDAKADIAVFRPADGVWYVMKSTGGNMILRFGLNGDVPVAADYDGDSKADIAVWRPSDRVWYVANSSGGYSFNQFGISTDQVVPADYDGDGKTDIAVYRDGVWYVRQSQSGDVFIVQFGLAGDVPTPADYDGVGKANVSVFRQGVWYYLNRTNNAVVQQFGVGGDVPVRSAFNP